MIHSNNDAIVEALQNHTCQETCLNDLYLFKNLVKDRNDRLSKKLKLGEWAIALHGMYESHHD